MRDRLVAGIFVGGASRRMGGRPKGLLAVEGVAIVDRWRALLDALGVPSILVGAGDAYAPRARRPDEIEGVGPIGGLVSLLRWAGHRRTLCVACDMPRVSLELLRRLVEAPDAIAVAARRDGGWEPMFARYEPAALDVTLDRIARGALSLRGLLDELPTRALELSDAEAGELDDWDTPEDLRG